MTALVSNIAIFPTLSVIVKIQTSWNKKEKERKTLFIHYPFAEQINFRTVYGCELAQLTIQSGTYTSDTSPVGSYWSR